MSPQLRGTPLSSRAQQRGAIGLMAALTLGLVLLFMLLVVDSGRLYMEQRKLQRVADMAVLEAVSRGGTCLGSTPTAASYANQSATRNAFTPSTTQTVSTTCGTLVTGSDKLRTFSADINKAEAIRVITTTVVPTSVAGGVWNLYSGAGVGLNTKLTASAVGATPGPTLAQISIRSTLATISTDDEASALNRVTAPFLGGSINLSVAGWNGLINSDINLLSYMKQLALDLKLSAVNYDQVLSTNTTLTQLIDTAITVAKANGATAEVTTALGNLNIPGINKTPLALGDILKLQTGTTSSGLDANVQLVQLLEAFIQAANKNSGLAVVIPADLLGIANITVKAKVIEPTQFSALGDPRLAKTNPLGPNRIYVRTAQVRTLISIKVTGLAAAAGITDALGNLIGTLSPILSGLLSLNLVTTLDSALCLLGKKCQQIDPQLVTSPEIDINIDAGGATTYVTDFNCPSASNQTKSLTLHTESSLADIRVGIIDPIAAFSSSAPPAVKPAPLIDIGIQTCQKLLGIGKCVDRVSFAGGGLAIIAQNEVGKSYGTLSYSSSSPLFAEPANVKSPPSIKKAPNNLDIVSSLADTLSGIKLQAYSPIAGNPLGNLIVNIGTAINGVSAILNPLIKNALSPILSPLLNNVLKLLGVSLNNVEIGANLSCNQGGRAQLVL